MTRVCLYVRNEYGGLPEECISTDAACFGGRDVDELTGGFPTERAKEEGVNVETFTNELATRTCFSRDSCLPHQFTALSPDPKS